MLDLFVFLCMIDLVKYEDALYDSIAKTIDLGCQIKHRSGMEWEWE